MLEEELLPIPHASRGCMLTSVQSCIFSRQADVAIALLHQA